MENPFSNFPFTFWDRFSFILVAIAGGAVKYLYQYQQTKSFSITMLLVELFISGFCGAMLAQVAVQFIDPSIASIAAGMGGFVGVRSLDWITRFLKDKKLQ